MSLTLTVEGLDDLEKYVEDLGELDMVRLKQEIAAKIRSDIEMRFMTSPSTQTGGYPHPGQFHWKALSESYMISNPRRRNGQLLIDTGALRDSLIREAAPGSFIDYTPSGFEIGTTLEYAAKQDAVRPFLYFHDALLLDIEEIIQNYILQNSSRDA